MGRSRHLNVGTARSQEAYFLKIRQAAQELLAGKANVPCPRADCTGVLEATRRGSMLTMRCPLCGVIYRGNSERLLEYFD